MKPAWLGLDAEGVRRFADQLPLSDEQRRWLISELFIQLGLDAQGRPFADRYRSEGSRCSGDITYREWARGDGLTKRYLREPIYSGDFEINERRERKKRKRRLKRAPFSDDARQIRWQLDRFLWAFGCLRVGYSEWVLPPGACEPYAGVWWYNQEIELALQNAESQCEAGEPQRAAYHALRAGQLFAEIALRAAHNEFFEKQKAIHEAQVESARSRRRQSDEERRETVRKYMLEGDKPTEAARNAALELGVSMTTVRKAFPSSHLPETPDF
ncbi:hypothetical protein [Sphingomonas sp.]|jgi:hypothetical protein|uniref:hypothetical protein n=1 Tax=Sphingomonas sp. TaxID=28214 RepID=UPI002DE6DD0E|nr:hypothetical protein [Sphingomonas sp.]